MPKLRMMIKPFYTKTNSLNTWYMQISNILIYTTPSTTYNAKYKTSSGEKYQDGRDAFFFSSPLLSTIRKFDYEGLNLAFRLQVSFFIH